MFFSACYILWGRLLDATTVALPSLCHKVSAIRVLGYFYFAVILFTTNVPDDMAICQVVQYSIPKWFQIFSCIGWRYEKLNLSKDLLPCHSVCNSLVLSQSCLHVHLTQDNLWLLHLIAIDLYVCHWNTLNGLIERVLPDLKKIRYF